MYTRNIVIPASVSQAVSYNEWWSPWQFCRGWQLRKSLELDGELHADALKAYGGLDEKGQVFIPLLASCITAYLVVGGKSVITALVDLGKKMADVGVNMPAKLSDPLNGIPLKDGSRAVLPVGLLEWGAHQHHLAWLHVRSLTQSFPAALRQPPRTEHIFWDHSTPDELRNPDRINFMTLGAALHDAPTERLEELLGMSV